MPQAAPIQLTERRAEEALTHQGESVLHYICTLPQIHGLSRRAQRRINRYYQRVEQTVQRACRTWLLARAARMAEAAHADALPFLPLEAALTWETTCLTDTLWSLTWQWSVTAGDTPLICRRQGDVWSLGSGLPCSLRHFDAGRRRRARPLSQLRRTARRQNLPAPGRRFSFAVAEDGLCCFWPAVPHPASRENYCCISIPFAQGEDGIC